MQHLDVRFGRRRYLLCEPAATPDGRPTGYGNLIRHAEQALRTAHALRMTLFLVAPARPINPAVYDLDSPDVRIVGQAGWRARILKLVWRMSVPLRYGAPLQWLTDRAVSGLRPVLEAAKHASRRRGWRRLDRTFDRWGHVCRDVSHRYERQVTTRWHNLFAEARERARATGSKREPLRLKLRPDAQRRVDELSAKAGVDPTRPIVALHVRESGFRQRGAARQQDIDRIRDARIDTYRPAVDWLVGRGYQVVRIGDRTMTPCDWPGMIDLATAPWKSGEFELWAMLHSRFFVASDSGPYFLGHLARVPVLAVNVIQVGYYTVRPQDRYICKRVFDRALGRHLSLAEMLTEQFIRNPLDLDRYEWIDNSPEDIREAVADFVASLESPGKPLTPLQEHHDRLLAEVASQWKPEWRTRRSLVFRRGGRGTISPGFAARYLTGLPTGAP